jgi:hypothetical protein
LAGFAGCLYSPAARFTEYEAAAPFVAWAVPVASLLVWPAARAGCGPGRGCCGETWLPAAAYPPDDLEGLTNGCAEPRRAPCPDAVEQQRPRFPGLGGALRLYKPVPPRLGRRRRLTGGRTGWAKVAEWWRGLRPPGVPFRQSSGVAMKPVAVVGRVMRSLAPLPNTQANVPAEHHSVREAASAPLPR